MQNKPRELSVLEVIIRIMGNIGEACVQRLVKVVENGGAYLEIYN